MSKAMSKIRKKILQPKYTDTANGQMYLQGLHACLCVHDPQLTGFSGVSNRPELETFPISHFPRFPPNSSHPKQMEHESD